MPSKHLQHNKGKELDRLFEQGVSGVSRAPRQMLTDAEIASAAAASKTGVGIWLLSHAKEILIGTISFAVGVGTTLLATHLMTGRPTTPQPSGTAMTIANDSTIVDTVYPVAETVYPIVETVYPIVETVYPVVETVCTPSLQDGASNPASPAIGTEPIIIKKTIVRRDTVRKQEQIIIRDTVYVIEN